MSYVLLVEDNRINAKLIDDFLSKSGFEVLVTSNGREAFNIAKGRVPFIVLMDIQILGISGIELAKMFKDEVKLKELPIIAISAFSEEKVSSLLNGNNYFDIFIEKPIDLDKLKDIVRGYEK